MFDFSVQSQKKRQSLFLNRPFVFFIGPQRCGTTWIDQYLRQRGDVCLPAEVKETFFFDRYFDRGVSFYKSLFLPSSGQRVCAEVSTTVFDASEGPTRVRSVIGEEVRLICPLRHPVERSYSLYRHYLRYGLVTGSLQEACEQIPQIITSSYYADHLRNWLSCFPRENFHFLFQEDLNTDPLYYARSLCEAMELPYQEAPRRLQARVNGRVGARHRFMALAAQKVAEALRHYRLYSVINFAKALGVKTLVFGNQNTTDQDGVMSADERAWLDERLVGEVQKLEEIIGPIPQWHRSHQILHSQETSHASRTSEMVRPSSSLATG